MKVEIQKITGRSAVADTDGLALLGQIQAPLTQGEHVDLDFSGVELFASPFFNVSVAVLVRDLGEDAFHKQLSMSNLSNLGKSVLDNSVSNAIETKDKTDQDRLRDLMRLLEEES